MLFKKFGIEKEVFEKMIDIFEKQSNIEKVSMYGSRARGDYKSSSDIDLCVHAMNFDRSNLLNELSSIDSNYEFDVIDYKHINKESLLRNIENESVIIYEKKSIK